MQSAGLAQVARPPSGGVLDRFLAPPIGRPTIFLGAWNLTWDDPGDPNCPCRGTLTVDTQADGEPQRPLVDQKSRL